MTERVIQPEEVGAYSRQDVDAALAGKSDNAHTHDSRYYTEGEVDGKLSDALAGKSDNTHDHDGRYYPRTDVDDALAGGINLFLL